MVVLRTKDGVIEFSDDGRGFEVFDDIDFA
jgi:hypothetical protein